MSKEIRVDVVSRHEQRLYGIWGTASINSAAAEETLFAIYTAKKKDGEGGALYAFRECVNENGSYELFVGGELQGEDLEPFTIPAGEYALAVVKPFLGLFWKRGIESASRYIRFKWIESSGRQLTGQRLEIRDREGESTRTELLYRLK